MFAIIIVSCIFLKKNMRELAFFHIKILHHLWMLEVYLLFYGKKK